MSDQAEQAYRAARYELNLAMTDAISALLRAEEAATRAAEHAGDARASAQERQALVRFARETGEAGSGLTTAWERVLEG